MPSISLVVCLFKERDFLERLLNRAEGAYDDLVVVHDGSEENRAGDAGRPAEIMQRPSPVDYAEAPLQKDYQSPSIPPRPGSIQELVAQKGGRYFEGPRSFQQEPHWPFAWSRTKHDWILRLDADEFPSADLKEWLKKFRSSSEPPSDVSGYTCLWPIWDGRSASTSRWPSGRNFLVNRKRVRFFGMVEQVPVADGHFEPLPFTLCHQPRRKSHGLANVIVRKQGSFWRSVIAHSLMGKPQDMSRWRWGDRGWPLFWSRLRSDSIITSLYRAIRSVAATMRSQWRDEKKIMPLVALATPVHHFLIGLNLRQLRNAAKSRGTEN